MVIFQDIIFLIEPNRLNQIHLDLFLFILTYYYTITHTYYKELKGKSYVGIIIILITSYYLKKIQ